MSNADMTKKYSPIKSIAIKNFKNLGEVNVSFEKSPIIALTGDNDAGKSSVIDALTVLAYNAYDNDQKGFIRLGTSGFGVQCELEDGTKITRIKKSDLNYYAIQYPDGKQWSTNKLGRGEESLPTNISDVMGCIKEPETKEMLHVRTYNNLRLFINTPNSENYKMVYEALKIENISNAIKKGSAEANEIKGWMNTAAIRRNTLQSTADSIIIYDIESLQNIKERTLALRNALEKECKAVDYSDLIKRKKVELGINKEILDAGLQTIDEVTARIINEYEKKRDTINNAKRAIEKYNGIDELADIDLSMADRFSRAINGMERSRGLISKRAVYAGVDSAEYIDTDVVSKLNKVVDARNRLSVLMKSVDSYVGLDSALEIDADRCTGRMEKALDILASIKRNVNNASQVKGTIDELECKIKECGARVVTCEQCGHEMIIEQ